MYWTNLELDTKTYPALRPGCGTAKCQDRDWETGLVYCSCCGWYAEDDAQERRKNRGS